MTQLHVLPYLHFGRLAVDIFVQILQLDFIAFLDSFFDSINADDFFIKILFYVSDQMDKVAFGTLQRLLVRH